MRLVVAGAVIRNGRVLAGRRSYPAEFAGGWELPGGKVQDGEEPDAALVRELAEELGVRVTVMQWLPHVQPIVDGWELRVAVVRLEQGEPASGEHDELRWLTADELDSVAWLPADRPFLPMLSDHLPRLER